jgi:hypothetical protein
VGQAIQSRCWACDDGLPRCPECDELSEPILAHFDVSIDHKPTRELFFRVCLTDAEGEEVRLCQRCQLEIMASYAQAFAMAKGGYQ